MDRESVRISVWRRLREVAVPDSRFHLDFSMYIPDYGGSDRIPETLRTLPFYAGRGVVFVTPDNNLHALRSTLLRESRPMLMTTYGIFRGFLFFPAGCVPEGSEEYAASLDGAERFGRSYDVEAVRALGPLDFLVTGASAVNRDGIRFGKGHGYFDLEWAMLRDLGMVDEETPVVACVHDVQFVDEELPANPTDTLVDWIITPTRTMKMLRAQRKPQGIRWEALDPGLLAAIPPLQELQALHGEHQLGGEGADSPS